MLFAVLVVLLDHVSLVVLAVLVLVFILDVLIVLISLMVVVVLVFVLCSCSSGCCHRRCSRQRVRSFCGLCVRP